MLLDKNNSNDFSFEDDDLNDLYNIKKYEEQLKELQPVDISSKVDLKKLEKETNESSIISEAFSYIKLFLLALVLALFVNHFIIFNATVPTGSMNNTIMEGDNILGSRLTYLFSKPQRGDIIIFDYPDDPKQKYVKRIIGIPGDVVEIKYENNVTNVYVNGTLLDEPYIKEPMIPQDLRFFVEKDCYFVLGDNRNNSKDSRYWENTFVHKDAIHAKVFMKYISNYEISIEFYENYDYGIK